jgi:hypothetical protein
MTHFEASLANILLPTEIAALMKCQTESRIEPLSDLAGLVDDSLHQSQLLVENLEKFADKLEVKNGFLSNVPDFSAPFLANQYTNAEIEGRRAFYGVPKTDVLTRIPSLFSVIKTAE